MRTQGTRTWRLAGAAVAAAALLATALAVEAAEVGGGFWAAASRGRIAAPRTGVAPVAFESNLRVDFDGTAEDLEGTARIRVYDEQGQIQLHQVPFAWTTGRGRAFRAECSFPELGEYLVQRIGEATGKSAVLAIEDCRARGAVRRRGESIALTLRVSGELSIEGGEPAPFRAVVRLR